MPRQVLSDSGAAFTGRHLGFVAELERRLWARGVSTIHGRPRHPQTQGKLERFHHTLKEWLADQAPATSVAHLQVLLDAFRFDYNERRPHQALPGVATTVGERYRASPPASPTAPAPPDQPDVDEPAGGAASGAPPRPAWPIEAVRRTHLSAANGHVTHRRWVIGLGRRFASTKVVVVDHGEVVEVYHGDVRLRCVRLERGVRYLGVAYEIPPPPECILSTTS